MGVSSSTSSEVRKRPNSIIIIAALWVITSIIVLSRAIDTLIYYDFSFDPTDPGLLELSQYAREWLNFGLPVETVLMLSVFALSLLMILAAYGLYTATRWSYKAAFATPAITALVNGIVVALYASAPEELGWSIDVPLYSALALINLGYLVGIVVYSRKQYFKQYLVGSLLKPIISTSQTAPVAVSASVPSWGERGEKIIKAIASAGSPLTWNELLLATDLDQDSLNKALAKLFQAKAIQKISDKGDTRYKVSYDLYKRHQAQLHLDSIIEGRTELLKWINQWKEVRKLNFSLEHEHFFLEGRHLDDFSKELISHAKSSVLLVNPFVEHCDLSTTLIDVKKKGINVKIITRTPHDQYPDNLTRKQEYHQKLKNEGISLIYKEKVHAKLIVVDNIIAISSSMNFFPDSSAGVSWEAGLISTDQKVVDSVVQSTLFRTS